MSQILDAEFVREDLTAVGYRFFDATGAWVGARVTAGVVQVPGNPAHFFVSLDEVPANAAGVVWNDLEQSSAVVSYLLPDTAATAEAVLHLPDGIEDGVNLQKAVRAILATAAGRATGGGTANPVFQNPAGTATRVEMTVDENGNRSAVSLP